MPNFKEYPRGGVANSRIVDAGEPHLPCVVLVDTSSSMDRVKDQLHEGLVELGESLSAQARGRVEFCIIGFNDDARILVPFVSAYDYEAPCFDCGGLSAMHAAVDLGLGELEARKAQYRANGTPFFRPWIFMLTDGGAKDEDNGAFERLLESQRGRHCTFFPVGIGDGVDKDLLKSLSENGRILTASQENVKGAFMWLGHSLNLAFNPRHTRTVVLPDVRDYQLEIEA